MDAARLDGIPVGVLAHRGGSITYVNGALCAIVGRPREELIGAHFGLVLDPADARRLTDSAARRGRGEPVPESWRSVKVRRPDGGERVVEVDVSLVGGDFLCAVRDVTEAAARRERLYALARLGVSLQACREERELADTVHRGVKAIELSDAWLAPDGDERLRITRIDLAGGGPFEALLGRPLVGFSAAWTPWLRRIWVEGEAYTDDALDEVGRFIGAPLAGAAQTIAASLGLTRGLGVRVDAGGAPHALLVLRGDWLHPDDLALARLLRGHLSAALDTARYLDGARRRIDDLVAVNDLARRALAEAQRSPQGVLEAAAACARDRLHADATVFLVADGRVRGAAGLRADVDRPVADVPLALAALASPEPVVVDDVRADPRISPEQRARGIAGAAVLAGFSAQRGPRGVLAVHDPAGRRFSVEEVAMARAIAAVAGVALENAELHDESRARLAELRETQARLVERERLAALGEAAAVVAHEVRNPLAVIFNAVSSLRRRAGPAPDVAPLLEMVMEEAGRLNQIVSDLLDFARPAEPQRRAEPLGPVAEGAVEAALARAQAAQHGGRVAVSVEVAPDAPPAWADARMVRQALLNLCLNALEAMPEGGKLAVTVRAVPERGRVAVDVRDAGPGVPAEARGRIFLPFYTTRSMGTGLGLAVVKRVADAHGGEASVRDAPGGGAVFTLELPAAPPAG
ncbi:MAG: ATP-binding protein [Polyangiales bacterium]